MEGNIKEKKKHKFNFVDAILIAVALLLVAALAFIFVFDGASALSGLFGKKETVRIRYAVEFSRVKDSIVENNISALEMGDEVIDAVKNYEIGNFVEYYPYLSEAIAMDKDGNAVVSEYPGYQSIIVVIEAEAEKDGYNYYIDGYDLQVGSQVSISTSEYADTGYCVVLREITGDQSIDAFGYAVGKLYEERQAMITATKERDAAAESETDAAAGSADNAVTGENESEAE